MVEEDPAIRPQQVRKLRKARHISQQTLAHEAQMSTGQLSRIENGRIRHPQPRTLLNLARALRVEIDDLLDGDC